VALFINAIAYPLFMGIIFGKSGRFNDLLQRAMIFFMVIGALIFIAFTFYHGFLKFSEILSLK